MDSPIRWGIYPVRRMKGMNMDAGTIAGASALMRTEQTQQALSMAMMKQVADQQKQMAAMLAQNASQAPQPAAGNGGGFLFSTYA